MSIKVVYDNYSDVCKHYTFGKRFLDEPESIIDRLDEHFDGVEFGQFDGCNPDNVYINSFTEVDTKEALIDFAENLEDVDEDLVLSFIESESYDPKNLASVDFDDCNLYPDISTDRELGEYLVDELGLELSKEKFLLYLDYEKLGRDIRLEEGGTFVDKGYFVSR